MKIRKNHKPHLILLILTGIFIWAQVIIQFFHNREINQGNYNQLSQAAIGDQDSIGFSAPDTAYIAKIEQLQNPFRINQKAPVNTQQKKIRHPIATVISPPSLKYLGFIADENEPFALIQLPNEQSVILKEGDQFQELYLQSVTIDSIIVCKEKHQFTYFLMGN